MHRRDVSVTTRLGLCDVDKILFIFFFQGRVFTGKKPASDEHGDIISIKRLQNKYLHLPDFFSGPLPN